MMFILLLVLKKENDNLVFCLPKGFESGTSNLNTFSGKSKTFFLFYKILNVFKDICIDKGYLDESYRLSTQDRDGVIKSEKGSLIEQGEEDSENIFYSKLDIIGQLLNAYDEPKILALAYRLGRSEKLTLIRFISIYIRLCICQIMQYMWMKCCFQSRQYSLNLPIS
ncbi:MAG: hypothetical protein HC769_31995 [Cyanobacteria bacterium CRU_2_1]|nr:hypothetical protein [Cyanobacteria bacterium CRU_2_1]